MTVLAEVVLFHSVLGLRTGVLGAAERLRKAGHTVHTPDLFDGEVFEDIAKGRAKFATIGRRGLIERTWSAVQSLPSLLVYGGFSMGGAPAELLAATRPGAQGCLLFHAALPPEAFGISVWPSGVPVQVHYADRDPYRNQQWIDRLRESVRRSGSSFDYFRYPVPGHLFTDAGVTEYNREADDLVWDRVIRFLERIEKP
ncbi:MAG: dienelactone hydrolase family protein [Methanoregulaceae archaeon]